MEGEELGVGETEGVAEAENPPPLPRRRGRHAGTL